MYCFLYIIIHPSSSAPCFLYIIIHPSSIVYRLGYFTVHPPPPAPSGPKFSNSENCCGSENAMQPKTFWDIEGHRGHFR